MTSVKVTSRANYKAKTRKSNNPSGRPSIWPFRTMNVGQSFVIPAEMKSAQASGRYVSQRNQALAPKRFKATYLSDGGVAVTRIA